MRLIGRIIWVAFAALLAGAAGLAIAATIGLEHATRIVTDPAAGQPNAFDMIDRGQAIFDQVTRIARPLSVIPALLLVVAGEVMRIRSFAYYVAGGGIAVAALPAAVYFGAHADAAGAPTLFLQTLAVAGFAAGAVYWMLAGRRA